MPVPIRVVIKAPSLSRISTLASLRIKEARSRNAVNHRVDKWRSNKAMDMLGIAGEYAAHRILGIPWDWDRPAGWREMDVPGWGEVRSTWHTDDRLLVKDNAEDKAHLDRPFMLVAVNHSRRSGLPAPDIETVTRLPIVIQGWAYGHEVAVPANWMAHMPRPCWAVRPEDLHDVRERPNNCQVGANLRSA